jgi:hypothetical protein
LPVEMPYFASHLAIVSLPFFEVYYQRHQK